jgi:hypothetical protein
MANTINFGYKNPVARTSYHEWESVLQSIQKPPVVKFLTVTKKEILSGESIILSWSSENTISVEIEGYGIYSSIDKKKIKPSNSSTYKVIFKGYYGVITEEISISVTPSPVFKTLFSDLYKLKKGESTILNWEIENISDAKLSGVKKDSLTISKKGQQIIKPEQSTSYKFQFTALDGKTIIEKFIYVEVFEEGIISFFKSDRQYIYPTMPVTLSWEVLNAIKVEIEGEGEFQLTGKLVVYPDKDSFYKIKVTDNFGVIERIISVKMLPLPVIQNLIIPFPSLQSKTNIIVNIPTFQEQSIPKFNTDKQSTFKSKINLNSLKQIELNQKLNLSIDLTEISFLARAKNLYKTLIIEYKKAYEKK